MTLSIEVELTLLTVLVVSVPLATGSGCFLADRVSLSSPSPGRGNHMLTNYIYTMRDTLTVTQKYQTSDSLEACRYLL